MTIQLRIGSTRMANKIYIQIIILTFLNSTVYSRITAVGQNESTQNYTQIFWIKHKNTKDKSYPQIQTKNDFKIIIQLENI